MSSGSMCRLWAVDPVRLSSRTSFELKSEFQDTDSSKISSI